MTDRKFIDDADRAANSAASEEALPESVWLARLTPQGLVLNEALPIDDLIRAARIIVGRVAWLEMNPSTVATEDISIPDWSRNQPPPRIAAVPPRKGIPGKTRRMSGLEPGM